MAGNIREFDMPGSDVFSPSDRPSAFEASTAAGAAEVGRSLASDIGGGIAKLGSAAQGIYDRAIVRPELSRLALEQSGLVAAATKSWQDFVRTADPNDASAADTWQQKYLEPMLETFGQHASTEAGQAYVDKATDALRQHFTMSTLADTASRSADALKQNEYNTLTNLSSALQSDPTKFGFVMDEYDRSFAEALKNSAVAPDVASQMQLEHERNGKILAAASLKGLADNYPAQFQEDLAKGVFDKTYGKFLDAPDTSGTGSLRDTMMAYAGKILRSENTTQNAERAAAARVSKEKGYQYELSITDPNTGVMNPNVDRKKLVGDITNDPDMSAEDKINTIKRIITTKPPAAKSTEGYENDLLKRIGTDNPPTVDEIRNSINNPDPNGRTLTNADGNFVMAQLLLRKQDPARAQAVASARAQAEGIYSPTDQFDAAQVRRDRSYKAWFTFAYQAAVSGGADPLDILNPASKNYLPSQYPGPDADASLYPQSFAPADQSAPSADGPGAGPFDAAGAMPFPLNVIVGTVQSWFQGPTGGPPAQVVAPPATRPPLEDILNGKTGSLEGGNILPTAYTIDAQRLAQAEVATYTSYGGASGGGITVGDITNNGMVPMSGSIASRQNVAMTAFMNAGYTMNQAAGIVGNLIAESGAGFSNQVGDGGSAKGIAQWHPDRQLYFERMFGHPVSKGTFDEQLQFVMWELNNTERVAGNALRNAVTPQDAADIVDRMYERSNGRARKQRIANAMALISNRNGGLGGLNV